MKKETAQKRVNEVQENYRNWLQLQEKLEDFYKDLQHSSELMDKLKAFYFGGEYRKINDLIEEEKAEIDLTTEGEYSVMSEDAVWNAFHDHQTFMWKILRFAVKELDQGGE